MRTHERAGYDCPFCLIQRGVHDERNRPADVVAVTEHAYARISPKWWPANDRAVLVIPRAHHENLYGIPTEAGHAVGTSRSRWPSRCAMGHARPAHAVRRAPRRRARPAPRLRLSARRPRARRGRRDG